MAGEEHIVVANLGQRFASNGSELTALAGVSFSVRRGEFLSIIGLSGCGKTTLLKAIGGLLEPTAGEVRVGGCTPREAQRRKELGFVFQDPSLLPWRTVIDNVRLPLQVNRLGHNGGSRAAEELVEMVGLAEFARYYPHQLSGGMKQRVALARALAFDPPLLLMDEPLGSLDEITRRAMRFELVRLWEADRNTDVMVTHSVAEAVTLSDRVLVLGGRPGRVIGVVPVEIPRPRDTSVEGSEAFVECTKRIQGLLAQGGPFGAALA